MRHNQVEKHVIPSGEHSKEWSGKWLAKLRRFRPDQDTESKEMVLEPGSDFTTLLEVSQNSSLFFDANISLDDLSCS